MNLVRPVEAFLTLTGPRVGPNRAPCTPFGVTITSLCSKLLTDLVEKRLALLSIFCTT